ncbi:DEAD/DEAH box helicase family protein [Marinifilum flexuosum]|uniref:DEAD/DEAH box helicase family protein n=1 Tax=Marinifilum flexuosum TaxID=1117708 RepID=UPI002495861A|nr:DEAD/DEAH box helicase family protein [Marinifilum flexuosum]
MAQKEAKARIKINKLLEEAGWILLENGKQKANVTFENHMTITEEFMDSLGENFEKTKSGFADYILLDEKGFPAIVLEAKSEEKNPLVGKEQARKYAKSQHCRFAILSNGNLHYMWDIENGSPYIISKFPEPDSINEFSKFKPNKEKLVKEIVADDYIAISQKPNYAKVAEYKKLETRKDFCIKNKLRFLRPYQKRAVHSIQKAVDNGKSRFLFEMATGTGKTLTAAAVIKLFLKTGNASRVLFLVDRLELEEQAKKAFVDYLKNDYSTAVYKENRDDWNKAEIVVTTVQSLLFNNKYQRIFKPTDFDLVISDEAHRSIGGNARALFEFFVGYKLGLTATPKDYLRKFDQKQSKSKDPRELERRLLLDTYNTFGCESGEPTFRYSLLDGVRDADGPFLINPYIIDARTEITTQLLSEEGYAAMDYSENGEDEENTYFKRDFEKKFFSEDTNRVFCQTFLENALKDPISNEIGKTICFAVSQNHAAKLTQLLNIMADKVWPGKYKSDFAVQVTSYISDAKQYTINFTNNNLMGSANFEDWYKTSKARVCVTVGMMTTGYDCPDILNLCLMRPIFSPTDFIQIKGRGTRKNTFNEDITDNKLREEIEIHEKKTFKLFDFFANCEYFEEEFDYDQVLKLPVKTSDQKKDYEGGTPTAPEFETFEKDAVESLKEQKVGYDGMKIDRMFFEKFEDTVKDDEFISDQVKEENWDAVIDYINREIMDKPAEYFNLLKLRKSINADRRISLKEILQYIFGFIPKFKSKYELLDEEFQKMMTLYPNEEDVNYNAIRYFFSSYIVDGKVRDIIENKKFGELNFNPSFTIEDYKAIPKKWRVIIPEYVKDYVSLNQFMN